MNTALLIKDIKLLLRDQKFQIFFLILVVLFILSAISSSVTYRAYSEEYQVLLNNHQNMTQDEHQMSLRTMLGSRNLIQVVDEPSPALLFSTYENYPNRLLNGVMFYTPQFMRFGVIGTEVFKLNWNFILGMLMGFIMLILSFEAISGEKRAGTLRLLSIYGFKRQSILWNKYLSYMVLYMIIIVPPALISMILFFALSGTWDVSYMMQFLLIMLLSIPFASFFVMLGIFISMAKNYRNAIVVVVFIWLLFVIIIPQSANIIGKQLSPIKTDVEYRQMGYVAWHSEFEIWAEEHGRYVNGNGYLHNGLRARAVYAADEKISLSEQQELADYKRQLLLIQRIASISPFTQYEKISEIVFDKGDYLLGFQKLSMQNTLAQVRNLMIEQDSRDETSINLYYSWAGSDFGPLMSEGLTTFSAQKFEHPNLLFVTDIPTDDAMSKSLKILLRLLPVMVLNLLLIIGSVVRFERLDIR
jgi:ABC-type transport system involved in multi-copper enzyme maturation permease subunit